MCAAERREQVELFWALLSYSDEMKVFSGKKCAGERIRGQMKKEFSPCAHAWYVYLYFVWMDLVFKWSEQQPSQQISS